MIKDEEYLLNTPIPLRYYIYMLILLPKPISDFIVNIGSGFNNCREAFFIWSYIMTHDTICDPPLPLDVKYFGVSVYDELYGMRMCMKTYSSFRYDTI